MNLPSCYFLTPTHLLEFIFLINMEGNLLRKDHSRALSSVVLNVAQK